MRFPTSVLCALICIALTACGGGSGTSAPPVVTAPPAPVTPPAPTGLFTDAQLRTGSDSRQALAPNDAAEWFAQNANIIRSLAVDDDFSDLAFLESTLANKRLVMLGESTHGAREYSLAKTRLIKYLHEQQGFNVLAIEGGLFDCENAQRHLEQREVPSAMNGCLFGVWRTQALRDLFDYIAATQDTATPLRITGFDVQPSGSDFGQRARNTGALVAKVSPDYALTVQALEQNYAQWTSDSLAADSATAGAITALTARLPQLHSDYAQLADYLSSNITQIVADGEFSERDVLIAAQYARTSPHYAEQLSERFAFESGGRPRDLGMAKNLLALSTRIYPNERIIGWAHNAHLRHRGTGFLASANMGSLVHAELADSMYTVGFYMYRGQHAFNDRSIRDVNAPIDNSLEAVFYRRRLAYLFLDLENASTDEPGSAWLDQRTPTWAWGSTRINLVLRSEYDGLLIIDKVSPPNYL